MVADDLALSLAERYVRPGQSVLDPFCGSGRLLVAAASQEGLRVGIDANPLACLLTRAKFARPDPRILASILDHSDRIRPDASRKTIDLRDNRKVAWFAPSVLAELTQIVAWINRLELDEPERLIIAAALSAATRDASFARKDGWKLHRLDAKARVNFTVSAWDAFRRRLRYCVHDLSHRLPVCSDALIHLGDSRDLLASSSNVVAPGTFDVVLTSPPYGDSRTTVQYGSASALCLEFASRINGLETVFDAARNIDARCLGSSTGSSSPVFAGELRRYWAGRKGTRLANAVIKFLSDYAQVCGGIVQSLKPGGTAALVVGQRSTGGYRLKLDRFTVDQFEALGLCTVSIAERRLRDKRLPKWINRYARCSSSRMRAKGITRTILSEIVLVFEKVSEGRAFRRRSSNA